MNNPVAPAWLVLKRTAWELECEFWCSGPSGSIYADWRSSKGWDSRLCVEAGMIQDIPCHSCIDFIWFLLILDPFSDNSSTTLQPISGWKMSHGMTSCLESQCFGHQRGSNFCTLLKHRFKFTIFQWERERSTARMCYFLSCPFVNRQFFECHSIPWIACSPDSQKMK